MKTGRLKYILFFALALASYINLSAQDFTATATKTTVGIGEQFQVNFTLNGNGGSFTPPSFSDFQNAGGPYQSSSFQSVNGVNSQSITLTYVLVANKEGSFTIGAASIKAGGKTLQSNTLTIKVVKGTPPAQQQKSTAQQGSKASGQGSMTDEQVKQNLFIKIIPSKTKVYEGEGIPITVKVYTRVELQNFQDATFPDYTGFYCENVPQKGQLELTRENYNGVAYQVVTLKQSVIFPQRTGKLKIDPATAQCVVQERVRSNDPNDIFGQFFGSYKRSVYNIKSDPVTIDIEPLPNTDKEFTGVVGHYTIKSSLDKSSVKANDAVNLNVTVSGDGELKLIDSIPFQFPPDFDHYDPKIADHLNVTPSGVSGSRSFSYVLIPRHQGKYKIPALDFTYFDPSKKTYTTLNLPEMDLDVAKGDNNSATVTVNSATVNKEDVKLLGSDIRYIHTGHLPAYHSDDYFLYSIPFFAGIFSPILCFIGFIIVRRRHIELNKDATSVKQRGATRMAKKRLKAANAFIASNNKEKFYEELHKAISDYLSDKFTIPVADLSRESITLKLTEKNVTPDTLQKLSTVLDNCEFVRYAPATVTGNLNEVYNSTVTLITQLEDEIVR
ncbi:MAG TPA: BatD family protein [Bacteroidia bacterium]|nr:BatD family protein [Bacteroidia bacterium]